MGDAVRDIGIVAVASGIDVLQSYHIFVGSSAAGRAGMHIAGSGICPRHHGRDCFSAWCDRGPTDAVHVGGGENGTASDRVFGIVSACISDYDAMASGWIAGAVGIYVFGTTVVWPGAERL